jgi:hypothetical protein
LLYNRERLFIHPIMASLYLNVYLKVHLSTQATNVGNVVQADSPKQSLSSPEVYFDSTLHYTKGKEINVSVDEIDSHGNTRSTTTTITGMGRSYQEFVFNQPDSVIRGSPNRRRIN